MSRDAEDHVCDGLLEPRTEPGPFDTKVCPYLNFHLDDRFLLRVEPERSEGHEAARWTAILIGVRVEGDDPRRELSPLHPDVLDRHRTGPSFRIETRYANVVPCSTLTVLISPETPN